jgi:phosphatidylinositol-bisphosphatase
LLGHQSNEERLLAIVKHENTKVHALFVFEVDNLGSLSVDMLMPIYGMFTVTIQSSTPAGCRVEVNVHGDTVVFLLPYDTSTALFFSQVNLAKESYNACSSHDTKHIAFDWLRGYESCRTGWDRFTKPHRSDGVPPDSAELQTGFPDNWPWGYIITPRPDGQTDMAVCESLIDEFDPLKQQPSQPLEIKVTSPTHKSPAYPSTNPFDPLHVDPFLPFNEASGTVRSSLSETNINSLKDEHKTSSSAQPSHAIHSHNNLNVVNRMYHVVEGHSPPLPRERPQGYHQLSSDSTEMDNPFDNFEESSRHTGQSKFWIEDSEVEMKVRVKDTDDLTKDTSDWTSNNMHRPLSMDSLDSTDENLDYKLRRMRSASSISAANATKLVQSDSHYPTRISHHDDVNERDRLAKPKSKSPRLFRKKMKSATVTGGSSPDLRSSWVTRYQPGVMLLSSGNMRESLIQRKLFERETEFCERKPLRLFCGTWNVNGQQAMQRVDKWLHSYEELPDIYAIGFQELDLSAEALIGKESNREEMWVDLVEMSLKMAGSYKQIRAVRLVGILLLVYVKESLMQHISDVDMDTVPCGIMGHLGNKGGVAVRFNIYHSSVCIINSHLAAQVEELEKRNQDYHQIYRKLEFFKNSNLPYSIMDHNVVIWMGDLNYRIQTSPELSCEIIKAMADAYQYSALLSHDQLTQQVKKGAVFSQFKEHPIDFKPTYKYDPSTNTWDTSEKNRAPAWCDRILYYSDNWEFINVVCYGSHPEMIISDHKPVSSVFMLQVKVVVPHKERDVLEQITWKLDKQENDTLPQVEINSSEFKFVDVKFMVEQTHYLTVRNIGQRPVQLTFLPTPDNDKICKPWLTIRPEKTLILTGEKVCISLTVLIDSDLAYKFSTDSEDLRDILVLHLNGGKDFFISIDGNVLKSCFGSSLETLIHVHSYIRDVPTAKLLDLTLSSSWAEYDDQAMSVHSNTSQPPLDIPKELYQLVNHLTLHGLHAEMLLTHGGLMSEREQIRDILDAGGNGDQNHLPGSVYSVAASFLMFLRSLAEPVVPHILHQKCMDACNSPTLCRQIILQMPIVHRRAFVFIISFLKKLLEHSQQNQMDAKFLASIFGDILLNPSRDVKDTPKKNQSKRKAAFVYQFLVNDITIDYK